MMKCTHGTSAQSFSEARKKKTKNKTKNTQGAALLRRYPRGGVTSVTSSRNVTPPRPIYPPPYLERNMSCSLTSDIIFSFLCPSIAAAAASLGEHATAPAERSSLCIAFNKPRCRSTLTRQARPESVCSSSEVVQPQFLSISGRLLSA